MGIDVKVLSLSELLRGLANSMDEAEPKEPPEPFTEEEAQAAHDDVEAFRLRLAKLVVRVGSVINHTDNIRYAKRLAQLHAYVNQAGQGLCSTGEILEEHVLHLKHDRECPCAKEEASEAPGGPVKAERVPLKTSDGRTVMVDPEFARSYENAPGLWQSALDASPTAE